MNCAAGASGAGVPFRDGPVRVGVGVGFRDGGMKEGPPGVGVPVRDGGNGEYVTGLWTGDGVLGRGWRGGLLCSGLEIAWWPISAGSTMCTWLSSFLGGGNGGASKSGLIFNVSLPGHDTI